MIDLETMARIRHLYDREHWRVGTITAELGLHHETVQERAPDEGGSRAEPLRFLRGICPGDAGNAPRLPGDAAVAAAPGAGCTLSVRQVRDKVRELITTLSTAASTGLPVAASAAWIRILTTGALAILKRTADGREGRADCFDGFHCPWEYREVRYLRALWAHGQAEQVDRRAQEKVGLSDRGFLQSLGRTVADRLKKDLGLAPLVVDAVPGHAQLELAKTYTERSNRTDAGCSEAVEH